ncbi:MAG: primosomal protein N' [Rikenellaceae bacterium]|nr:primosomal protein N' [Rikenellaceae bacterium]
MSRYADIVLPLAQPAYTFAVGEGVEVCVGDAVAVQFGKSAVYTGIVWRLHDTPPARGTAKPILKVLYDKPLLSELQMQFWEWIAEYYICSVGEVMRVALPSAIKAKAKCEEEFLPYTPKRETTVGLVADAFTEEVRAKMARRAPKRYEALCAIEEAGGVVPRHVVALDAAALKSLAKSGLVEMGERDYTLDCEWSKTLLPKLSPAQTKALNEIREGLTDRRVALLHGVTSSGKTEIYTHLIEERLSHGEDVLFLVPEISLTTQLVERMRSLFGESVTVYHSKLTPQQRTKLYTDMLSSESGNFVVGARSALFLPYKKLGLVVVDEEHDSSYKQTEPNPRYNGRDAAILLATLHDAKVVLGSATPSLESYANTLSGKYAYTQLTERYGGVEMPDIVISDTVRNVKRNERKLHFNKELLDGIAERLECNEQVILFQNRRGYSPYMECPSCGWSARCPRCNVTLSAHQQKGRMICHYCGYNEPIERYCPNCKSGELRPMGFGTERVEEAITELFPEARVLRLDGDTATSSTAYNRIIGAFARHEADILVGTQIVSKGLDFADVTLIGILNGDNLLASPDFRAEERAWQLLMQVAGRAGRRDKRGEVIIQTAEPEHSVYALVGDYERVATKLLAERKQFGYPPFVRIVKITMRTSNKELLVKSSLQLGEQLRNRFGRRVLGPVAPLIDRVRGEYRVELMLKVEVESSFSRARAILREEISKLKSEKSYRNIVVICDVDIL